MVLIAALLICCSLPIYDSLTQLARGENLTRPGTKNIGGSRAVLDTRLPWYTSGFE